MSGSTLPDLRSIDRTVIGSFLAEHGEPAFRKRQIFEWLWTKGVTSVDLMSNLPRSTRELLKKHFSFPAALAIKDQLSSDGTRKFLFRVEGEHFIEGVLIPSDDRNTACISSQAGCPLACTFCATGRSGFKRNLTSGEIFDQVYHLNGVSLQLSGRKLSNIVFMGMGEPLLNYESVRDAISHLTDPAGFGMSPQRITLSSVGIPKMIRRMGEEQVKFQFALSLHAATDIKRNQIIPLNKQHPLQELSESLVFLNKHTGTRITIEYILFRDFNDTREDAAALAVFCRDFPVKVNLIEYNPVEGVPYRKPEPNQVKKFLDYLEGRNMVVNVRKSRGADIAAACGQLAGSAEPK